MIHDTTLYPATPSFIVEEGGGQLLTLDLIDSLKDGAYGLWLPHRSKSGEKPIVIIKCHSVDENTIKFTCPFCLTSNRKNARHAVHEHGNRPHDLSPRDHGHRFPHCTYGNVRKSPADDCYNGFYLFVTRSTRGARVSEVYQKKRRANDFNDFAAKRKLWNPPERVLAPASPSSESEREPDMLDALADSLAEEESDDLLCQLADRALSDEDDCNEESVSH